MSTASTTTGTPSVGAATAAGLPPNPILLQRRLEETYRRFYASAYALADPALAAERDALLFDRSRVGREPLLEPVPPYVSSGQDVATAIANLKGLDGGLARQAGEF